MEGETLEFSKSVYHGNYYPSNDTILHEPIILTTSGDPVISLSGRKQIDIFILVSFNVML